MGIIEKSMETTGIIGIILGFYRDNGMAIWLSGLGFRVYGLGFRVTMAARDKKHSDSLYGGCSKGPCKEGAIGNTLPKRGS